MTRILGAERVPGGFTITTEACVAYMRDGRRSPRACDEQVDEALAALEEQRGQDARRRRRPAAGVGALGRARVDAGDARHRPEPRAQRRVGRRGWRAKTEQRALRVGLLPALRADVRQRRARHRGQALRGRDQARQGRPRRQGGHRARRRGAAASSRAASRSSTSSPPTRASSSSRRSGPSSTPGTASARRTYRRINRIPDDWGTAVNVQQMVFGNKGDTQRLGRRLQPRRGHRRAASPAATSSSTPRARTSSPACATRSTSPSSATCMPEVHAQLHGDPAHARAPLRRHAGHRVHGRGRAAVHAADAQRQAPGAGGGALRGRRGRARGCSTRRRR